MALEMYTDDARTTKILQENIFNYVNASTVTFTFVGITSTDVEKVYKWNGTSYTTLTLTTHYTMTSTQITLTTAGKMTAAGQHILIMPTNKLLMSFTGAQGASRSAYQKIVFYKADTTTIYDGLNLFSSDLTLSTANQTNFSATLSGFAPFVVDAAMAIYRSNSINDPVAGIGITTPSLAAYPNLEDCAVIMNGQYIGDVWATDGATTIVLPVGTDLAGKYNGTSDAIQIVATGTLRFALDVAGNGTVPADENFKRCVTIPTLNMATRQRAVYMKETVIIPSTTSETLSMPFKLIGQTYAGS